MITVNVLKGFPFQEGRKQASHGDKPYMVLAFILDNSASQKLCFKFSFFFFSSKEVGLLRSLSHSYKIALRSYIISFCVCHDTIKINEFYFNNQFYFPEINVMNLNINRLP